MKKVTLMLVGVLLSVMVYAQPGQRPEERKGGKQGSGNKGDRRMEMVDKLNLTDVQQKQIEEFRYSFKKTSNANRNELNIKEAQLKAETSMDQIDMKKVDGLVKEINGLRSENFKLKIKHKLEVRAILDDKQKIIFDEMPMGGKRDRNRN